MKLIISPRAEKELKKIPKIDQIAIAKKIRSIKNSSITIKKEKLADYKNIFKIRVGYYRIVYKKAAKEIYIILISHRKDIYRLINQLLH